MKDGSENSVKASVQISSYADQISPEIKGKEKKNKLVEVLPMHFQKL